MPKPTRITPLQHIIDEFAMVISRTTIEKNNSMNTVKTEILEDAISKMMSAFKKLENLANTSS